MPLSTTLRRALSVAAACLFGLVTTVVIATPASANGGAQNDGITSCLPTGGYALPFHVFSGEEFAVKVTGITTNPEFPQTMDSLTGSVIEPGHSPLFWLLAPPGATAASFTVTWEKVGDPSITGSFSGTAVQEFPECEPSVSAEVTATCDETATVKLATTSDGPMTFLVGGAEHVVAASSSLTLTDVPMTSGGLAIDVLHAPLQAYVPLIRFTWTEPTGCATTPATTTTTTTVTTTTTTTSTTTTSITTTTAGLASTGSSLTGVIGVGAALVALGVGLLVLLGVRRRRADAG